MSSRWSRPRRCSRPVLAALFLRALGSVRVRAGGVGAQRLATAAGRPSCRPCCWCRSTAPASPGRGISIPDPPGMLVKNFAFLVLVWVAAGQAAIEAAPWRQQRRGRAAASTRAAGDRRSCSVGCTRTSAIELDGVRAARPRVLHRVRRLHGDTTRRAPRGDGGRHQSGAARSTPRRAWPARRCALGSAERVVGMGRALLAPFGWRRATLAAFLALDEPAEQIAFWERHLDTRGFRVATDTLLSVDRLRAVYAPPFLAFLPQPLRARHARAARALLRHASQPDERLCARAAAGRA